MVQAVRGFFATALALMPTRTKQEADEADKVGAFTADYSEPVQEEVEAANSSCAELFETGNWVSVNRKS